MEHENPKYLLYFDLHSYQENEFNTIRKLVKNIINVRYYYLDIDIQFNQEIINYDAIKKDLSDNIMLLIGQIEDNLADDVVYEINTLLGTEKVIRRRSVHDFNRTGYSDEQLYAMYQNYINESKNITYIEEEYNEDFLNLSQDFCYANLPFLNDDNYLSFCNLLINNAHNLNSFEFLQENNVCEALFRNFTYFIKYISLINFPELIKYYNKDTIKILRYIRAFVNDSDTSNDNIKEILLYKYILSRFKIKQFFYDPEEGFNQIREEVDKIIEIRKNEVIEAFDQKVHLFKENYEIFSIGDDETKSFKSYKAISLYLKKHFDVLKPLLKSFRGIIDNSVKFNSKQNNPELNKKALERLKKYRIVKDYSEKYGNYTINIESGEHIPFLQGKWFEYYTASVCEEIIENYRNQGYFPDYGIYQNVLVQINDVKRELDIIIYLNGTIFYIENKIDSKNTYKNDIFKYCENSENMNVQVNNCMLVYLEGEDRLNERIKICNFNSFITRFKKEALKILEEDRIKYLANQKSQEQALHLAQEITKIKDKEKNSLSLSYYYDEDLELQKIERLIDKYDDEASKLLTLSKFKLFDDLDETVADINDVILNKKYQEYKEKYEIKYLNMINCKSIDENLILGMIDDLITLNIKDESYLEYLYCLNNDFDQFFKIGGRDLNVKLKVLCEYGINYPNCMEIIGSFLTSPILLTNNDSHYLFIAFIKRINQQFIKSEYIDELANLVIRYIENVQSILKTEIKNTRDNFIINHREKEFISVLAYTLGMKHLGNFNLQGLLIKDNPGFILRMKGNNEWYHLFLKYHEVGNLLLKFNPVKHYFYESNYIDASSYLMLNYKLLEDELNNIKKCDERLIFEVSRTEQTGKMLKKLEESQVIAGFKEVKKANVNIAIFKDKLSYNWFINYCWVGVALTFCSDSEYDFTNINIYINNEEVKVLFIKEGKFLTLCLGKIINNAFRLLLIKTSKNNLANTLMSINDEDFIYTLENIKTKCEELRGEKHE